MKRNEKMKKGCHASKNEISMVMVTVVGGGETRMHWWINIGIDQVPRSPSAREAQGRAQLSNAQ
jgi:hypothetical protein